MNTPDERSDGALPRGFVLDDGAGPAHRISRAQTGLLVGAIVARAQQPRRRSVKWLRLVLPLAAVLAVAGAAAAASWTGHVDRVERNRASRSVNLPTTFPTPRRHPEATVPQPTLPLSPEPNTTSLEPSVPAVEGLAHRPHREVRTREDLIRMASRLREQRLWRQAERTYQQVLDTFPGTEQAYAATMSAASLRLEHLGEARGALRMFEAMIRQRPHGALAEEARYGIAEAYRTLGDARAEARALRAFLVAHPDAAMRPRVEARLRALSAVAP
jgi:tetratricopeptide (TPR) repeat protein